MKHAKHALISSDTLIATDGADRFYVRAGDGHEVVSGFDPSEDRVLFDIGHAYNDILYLGQLSDGLTFDNGYGTASFTVSAADENHDGITDTLIAASSGDSITLLGITPTDLYGWSLVGG